MRAVWEAGGLGNLGRAAGAQQKLKAHHSNRSHGGLSLTEAASSSPALLSQEGEGNT